MEKILKNIEEINNIFNEAVECGNKIIYFENEKERIIAEKKKIEDKPTDTNIFTWIISLGPAILGFLFTESLIVGAIGFVVGFVLELVIWYFIDSKITHKTEKAKESAKIYYDKNMSYIISEENDLLLKLDELQKSSEWLDMEKSIPQDYQNAHALGCFVKYVKNNRVETLKEAINLYEDELLKLNMLQMQENQIDLVNRSLEKQDEHIAISQEIYNEQKIQGEFQKKQMKMQKKQLNHARAQTLINAIQLTQLKNLKNEIEKK